MDDKRLTLITDKGKFSFGISEDDCPQTFFCDFYGANHLFGSKVVEIKDIPVTSKNKEYRHCLPRHRSFMKKIQQEVFHDIGEPLPEIHGYEIITSDGMGSTHRSIFSFQGVADTAIPVKLVETDDHISNEKYRILKPQFRVRPHE